MRMAKTFALKQMIAMRSNGVWLALFCGFVVCSSGCYTRRAPVKPVVNFVAPVRPALPPPTGTELQPPPDVQSPPPEEPEIATENAQPAKPHVTAPAVTEPSEAEKPVPTIAPEVTTEEMVTAKAATQRSLDIAEKGLALVQGKRLNATQADLASKVRGFADNAREAMHSGDWERAKNLAKKAEVLSQQLTASL
jgi:hypothetical protein